MESHTPRSNHVPSIYPHSSPYILGPSAEEKVNQSHSINHSTRNSEQFI